MVVKSIHQPTADELLAAVQSIDKSLRKIVKLLKKEQ